jgi:rhodanese-related sulfurtransferase
MKLAYIILFFVSTFFIYAENVNIKKDLPYVEVKEAGKIVRIKRTNNKNSYLTNTFALTSRPSPPFFIQPFFVDDNVEKFGELEVLDLISKNKGLFIDARLENWYTKSSIPGAINIPFKIFLSESKERKKVLKSLGGVYKDSKWNFSKAKTILLYCNGAWCGQSPIAINALISVGYPKDKMKYYRGGMQAWQLLGLTTIVPKGLK